MAAQFHKPDSLPTPEQFLAGYHPVVQDLANALRALVKQTLPGVAERVYPGWRLIGYRMRQGGRDAYLGFVAPLSDGAALGFEYGALLDDPDRLLEGSGSQLRQITVRRGSDIRPEAFARLIRQAAELALARHPIKGRRTARQPTTSDRQRREKL